MPHLLYRGYNAQGDDVTVEARETSTTRYADIFEYTLHAQVTIRRAGRNALVASTDVDLVRTRSSGRRSWAAFAGTQSSREGITCVAAAQDTLRALLAAVARRAYAGIVFTD